MRFIWFYWVKSVCKWFINTMCPIYFFRIFSRETLVQSMTTWMILCKSLLQQPLFLQLQLQKTNVIDMSATNEKQGLTMWSLAVPLQNVKFKKLCWMDFYHNCQLSWKINQRHFLATVDSLNQENIILHKQFLPFSWPGFSMTIQ